MVSSAADTWSSVEQWPRWGETLKAGLSPNRMLVHRTLSHSAVYSAYMFGEYGVEDADFVQIVHRLWGGCVEV